MRVYAVLFYIQQTEGFPNSEWDDRPIPDTVKAMSTHPPYNYASKPIKFENGRLDLMKTYIEWVTFYSRSKKITPPTYTRNGTKHSYFYTETKITKNS